MEPFTPSLHMRVLVGGTNSLFHTEFLRQARLEIVGQDLHLSQHQREERCKFAMVANKDASILQERINERVSIVSKRVYVPEWDPTRASSAQTGNNQFCRSHVTPPAMARVGWEASPACLKGCNAHHTGSLMGLSEQNRSR